MAKRAIRRLETAADVAGCEVRDALRRCRTLGERVDWLLRRAKATQREATEVKGDALLPAGLVGAFGAYANAVAKLSKEARENFAAVKEALAGEDADSIKGELVDTLDEFISSLPKAQRAQLWAQLEDEAKDAVLN